MYFWLQIGQIEGLHVTPNFSASFLRSRDLLARLIICTVKMKFFAGAELRFYTNFLSTSAVAGSQCLVCG